MSVDKYISILHLVTYNFHSSCKHMHVNIKSICNKEHKGVTCNMTSWSNSPQSTISPQSTKCLGRIIRPFYISLVITSGQVEFLSPACDNLMMSMMEICCTRVMALDLCQNFVSAQYLENKLTDFTKFYICIHIYKI